MTSVIYASLLAVLICWLSLNVIKKRRKNKVSIGDGGNEELKLLWLHNKCRIYY